MASAVRTLKQELDTFDSTMRQDNIIPPQVLATMHDIFYAGAAACHAIQEDVRAKVNEESIAGLGHTVEEVRGAYHKALGVEIGEYLARRLLESGHL